MTKARPAVGRVRDDVQAAINKRHKCPELAASRLRSALSSVDPKVIESHVRATHSKGVADRIISDLWRLLIDHPAPGRQVSGRPVAKKVMIHK